jgi:hypothetical protein
LWHKTKRTEAHRFALGQSRLARLSRGQWHAAGWRTVARTLHVLVGSETRKGNLFVRVLWVRRGVFSPAPYMPRSNSGFRPISSNVSTTSMRFSFLVLSPPLRCCSCCVRGSSARDQPVAVYLAVIAATPHFVALRRLSPPSGVVKSGRGVGPASARERLAKLPEETDWPRLLTTEIAISVASLIIATLSDTLCQGGARAKWVRCLNLACILVSCPTLRGPRL